MNGKRLLLIIAAFFAAALAMGGVRAPDQQTTRDFTIGLKGPNEYCDTIKVSAPNEVDALYYAHEYCPTCSLKDLTGEYVRGEAPWETMTPLSQAFCLEK